MLVNHAQMCAALKSIVGRMVVNKGLQDDFVQEAMAHLLRVTTEFPDERPSWYLQSCRFHLRDVANLGKSVDSPKRRRLGCEIASESVETESLPDYLLVDECIREEVSANDLMTELRGGLDEVERSILEQLVEGFGVCKIAKKLGLSAAAVRKRRLVIAAMAIQLGCTPYANLVPF